MLPDELLPPLLLTLLRCALPLTSTTGQSAARAASVAAVASRTRAAAAAIVWLETSTCASSALRSASLNASHHVPRGASSAGCATFQPAASLYAAGVGAVGRT